MEKTKADYEMELYNILAQENSDTIYSYIIENWTPKAIITELIKTDLLIEELNEQLRLYNVVGRSEQLLCPICSSENVDAEFNHYNFCRDCNHDWAK